MAESCSTAPPPVSLRRIRSGRALRRVFFVLVCAVVGAASFGLLGPSTSGATASGGGYQLQVAYPRVSRPGLAAGLTVTVRRPGGFAGAITVAFTSAYLDVFDVDGVNPEPLGATTTADREIDLFQTPTDGDEMKISFAARLQSGVPPGRVKGSVAIVENGRDLVAVLVRTVVMP